MNTDHYCSKKPITKHVHIRYEHLLDKSALISVTSNLFGNKYYDLKDDKVRHYPKYNNDNRDLLRYKYL